MLNALQIKQKIIPYRPFHRAVDETLRIPEQCWAFLYLNFTRVLQFSSNQGCRQLLTTLGGGGGLNL